DAPLADVDVRSIETAATGKLRPGQLAPGIVHELPRARRQHVDVAALPARIQRRTDRVDRGLLAVDADLVDEDAQRFGRRDVQLPRATAAVAILHPALSQLGH